MAYQPLLISNYETGLEKDLEPWLLPNDGFPQLYDCYIWRGRIIRKLGVKQVGRLQRYNPTGGTNLGVHAAKPQSFGPITFPSAVMPAPGPYPVVRGSVSITDGTVTYTDDSAGNLIAATPAQVITGISNAAAAVVSFAGAPLFSIGDIVWITGVTGMTGINSIPLTIAGLGANSITVNYNSTLAPAWISGGSVVWYGGTINYATGIYTVIFYNAFTGTPVIARGAYYPNQPVMGLTEEDTPAINQEQLIAFDQNKAYKFDNVLQEFRDISFDTSIATQTGPIIWNSTNADFFWSLDYANALFTCNFVSGDPIRYLAVSAAVGTPEVWREFKPPVNKAANKFLDRARMIFAYRGRLVFINTIESGVGAGTYPQRARWSQNGTPYYRTGGVDTPPAPYASDVTAWADDIGGKGGYADAATREEALSGAFIDDNLVVFFERSTWLLRYTNDPNNTFVWERVNQDLGSESTFSTITFDKGMFTVGNTGIITCDGNNVVRIDQKIPDEVFKFQNKTEGAKRIHGIRNFKKQLAYWTVPNDVGGEVYPNRVLMVNYIEASYAFFRDSFTCFGTYQPYYDLTWGSPELNTPWNSWNYSWNNPTGQSFDPQLVAGNQQGFVLMLDQKLQPETTLYIKSITPGVHPVFVSTDHNLVSNQFVSLRYLQGTGNLSQFMITPPAPERVFKVTKIDANKFSLSYLDANGNEINDFDPVFTYTDSGEILVYNNFSIYTKRFNLGMNEGKQSSLGFTDFYVDVDQGGAFQADIYTDEDTSRPILSSIVSLSAEPTTSFTLKKSWKRAYTRMVGQLYQYSLYLNDGQMFDQSNHQTNFALHGMIMWVGKAGRLPYG